MELVNEMIYRLRGRILYVKKKGTPYLIRFFRPTRSGANNSEYNFQTLALAMKMEKMTTPSTIRRNDSVFFYHVHSVANKSFLHFTELKKGLKID